MASALVMGEASLWRTTLRFILFVVYLALVLINVLGERSWLASGLFAKFESGLNRV